MRICELFKQQNDVYRVHEREDEPSLILPCFPSKNSLSGSYHLTSETFSRDTSDFPHACFPPWGAFPLSPFCKRRNIRHRVSRSYDKTPVKGQPEQERVSRISSMLSRPREPSSRIHFQPRNGGRARRTSIARILEM